MDTTGPCSRSSSSPSFLILILIYMLCYANQDPKRSKVQMIKPKYIQTSKKPCVQIAGPRNILFLPISPSSSPDLLSLFRLCRLQWKWKPKKIFPPSPPPVVDTSSIPIMSAFINFQNFSVEENKFIIGKRQGCIIYCKSSYIIYSL